MKALRIERLFGLVLPLAFILGCGASPTRSLMSVTISPSAADVRNSPSGTAQFIATGHYNTSPHTVTPLQATWGASTSPAKIASITQSGLATCINGTSGTTAIEAWITITGPVCGLIDSAGRPCGSIGAAANLTCP